MGILNANYFLCSQVLCRLVRQDYGADSGDEWWQERSGFTRQLCLYREGAHRRSRPDRALEVSSFATERQQVLADRLLSLMIKAVTAR